VRECLARIATLAGIVAAATLVIAVGKAADNYPSRSIVLVIPLAPGGTTDIMARAVADKMSEALGQRIVIENRNAGGSGTVGTREVARAIPDGYTIILGYTSTLATGPHIFSNAGYDPRKDLQAIALTGVVPLALVVPASAPYSTMAEFVKFLRNPDRPMTFASAGIGTPGHLAGELLKLKLNNNLTHVPYKGAAPALNDVVGGHVDFYFPGFPAAVPLMQGGKVKLLAVSTAKRASAAPDIPSVAEATGIADFDFALWVGFFGPRALPMDIANRLNAAINQILLEPEMKTRLQNDGAEVSALSIDEFSGFVRAEIAKYQAIITAADIKPE